MSERQSPYWIGNVTRIDFSPKVFHLRPDPIVPAYGGRTVPPPMAIVLPFTRRTTG